MIKKAIEYNGDLQAYLKKYNYQPELTNKLDCVGEHNFTQELINEIVLWKVNRYVIAHQKLNNGLNQLVGLRNGEHKKGIDALSMLLNTHGVDLPMASTILRFRNPNVFQIIDQHAYRAVYGSKYPLYTAAPVSRKIETYYGYLDKLIELCRKRKIDFVTSDRLLYIFDKEHNGKL
jgi:hypothetical protein